MKKHGAVFKQSQDDFPCFVELGKNTPSFGLNRWDSNCLRFTPADDEGFALRGDRRQLLYKGHRRSHRFTIHSDTTFEYDCILLKEPESNVVTLRMEGAENFDFFKQPDFVPDPFLKGSYAVYRKETLIGQGTGKLCHIHRPLIIDANGRKTWGELAIIGNMLHITIPEQWLANAKYPVVVDPTIGTSTVGSQSTWDADPPEPWVPLCFECDIPVNRFTVSEKLEGSCTAYFHANRDDWEAGGRAVLYSNNNNQPHTRRSAQESWINLRVTTGNPAGWRSGTFITNDAIPAGTQIWFGLFAEYFWLPRFDYGAVFWNSWWNDAVIPNTYPGYRNVNVANSSWTFKPSMYFTYTSAQNYIRTLTQGVNLSDTGKITAEYRRTAPQTARLTDTQNLKADYKREASENVNGTDAVNALFSFFRHCFESVGNNAALARLPVFNRFVSEGINASDGIKNNRELNIKFVDTAVNADVTNRSQGFVRTVIESVKIAGDFDFTVLFLRTLHETQGANDNFQQVRNFIRYLYVEAGNLAETAYCGNSYRTVQDTVQAEGSAFRHLLIFVKILTTSLVRDFIIRRFLVAREELVLKSCITREITLESKIN